MKKTILLAAFIACTTLVQAAAVSWTSDMFKLVDDKGTTLSALDSGSIVLTLLGTDMEKFSDAKVLATSTINASSKNKGKVSGVYEFTYGGADSLANGNALAVLFKDGDGKLNKLLNADGTADMFVTYEISGLGDNTWSRTDYVFATGNFQASSIPEPTSGLLLLVGGALMALRRKRK